MKNLVIVESPAKAKTISKFLGSDYTVMASMGHVRDLPKSQLGFDPADNFKPKYLVSTDKKKVISDLKKHITKDTTIYLAADEDREGEAIAWHLIPALKIEKNPIKRIVFHEITKDAILKALANPRDVDQHLVDAQQARRILDRAVGYELSPLLWKKVRYGLSAGRVQSVAVRIIVDRENEIRAFIPVIKEKPAEKVYTKKEVDSLINKTKKQTEQKTKEIVKKELENTKVMEPTQVVYVKPRPDLVDDDAVIEKKILPFVRIEFNDKKLLIHTKYKVSKKFSVNKENKLIIDYKAKVNFYTKRENLESKTFPKIAVGNHKNEGFFRVVLELEDKPSKYDVTYKDNLITVSKKD